MRSHSLAMALLCGGVLTLPGLAADAAATKDVDGDKLPAGQFTGKLMSVPGSDGAFTVGVEIEHAEAGPNATRDEIKQVQQATKDLQQIERLHAEIAKARNINEYRQRVINLANEMQKLQQQGIRQQLKPNANIKIVTDHKDVDFHTADEMKVRVLTLPARFDDKGNPKEYTKAELKEMKGKDSSLPGYESTVENLKVGDRVQVTLAHAKPMEKSGDKDKDSEVKKGHEVTMILILSENAQGDGKKK